MRGNRLVAAALDGGAPVGVRIRCRVQTKGALRGPLTLLARLLIPPAAGQSAQRWLAVA